MQNFDMMQFIAQLFTFFLPFLFALSFHEFAHGWMAKRCGDNTAELMGRLTLNPFAHADVLGTFVLPIMAMVTGAPLFGWAKPVPVNPRNLNNIKNDMFWVALAGPASNVLLAIVGAVVFRTMVAFMPLETSTAPYFKTIVTFVFINLLLAIFNMVPFHPLDGGKILARFLPYRWNVFLENKQSYLQIILIVIFVAGGFDYLSYPIRYVMGLLGMPA